MKTLLFFTMMLFGAFLYAQKDDIPTIRVGWGDTIPIFLCSTYDEAIFTIRGSKYEYKDNYEVIMSDRKENVDIKSCWVWKQEPAPFSRVYKGATVTLYLKAEYPKGCDEFD